MKYLGLCQGMNSNATLIFSFWLIFKAAKEFILNSTYVIINYSSDKRNDEQKNK